MREVRYYECENCGRHWRSESQARECEAAPIPPPPGVASGDKVRFRTCTQRVVTAEVVAVRLGARVAGQPGGHLWLLELDRELHLGARTGGFSRVQAAEHCLPDPRTGRPTRSGGRTPAPEAVSLAP